MQRINTVKLHRLIMSLKKEEKRFFKLFTKKQNLKEDRFYLKIFNYLDKVVEVDRDEYKQKFKDVKGLSGLQNYLYGLILKSLRNQRAYQDIDTILREGLTDLEIFYKKELFAESQEKLEELLNLAKVHDKVFFLPMLYEWWFILENTHFHYHNVNESLLSKKTQQYTDSINNLREYHLYRINLGRLMWLIKANDSKSIVNDVTTMIELLPDYESNKDKYSLSILIQALQLRRVCEAVLMNNGNSFLYGKELTTILKKQPQKVFEAHEEYYYKTLASQMGNAPTVEILHTIIVEIESGIVKNKKYLDNHLSIHVFMNKIDVYLLTSDFQGMKHYIEQCKDIIELMTNSSSQYFHDFWYYKLMLYYYATKNYQAALNIFETFLWKKEISIMFKKVALYLKMIIYYEEEEYILLAAFLKNFTRFLRQKEALLDPEKQLIVLMNKLIKLPQSEHKAVLRLVRKEMVTFLENVDTAQKEFLMYFNYIGWIDSQLTGNAFKELFFRHVGDVELV